MSNSRLASINTKPIDRIISSNLTAEIESLKPTTSGVQLILTNIVSDSDRELQKIRINVASKHMLEYWEGANMGVLNARSLNTGALNPGDIIKIRANLFPLQSRILPSSYDFGFYMYMAGIEASGYALSSPEKINTKRVSRFTQYIKILRKRIYENLINVLGNEQGNFAAAILIGETKAIPQIISENMRNSGVSHILSVSGLHLSLVAMIFFVSSRAVLNCSNFMAYNTNIKLIAAIISIIGSFLYLQISGNNIAATRAFVMTTIFTIAMMIGRSPMPLRSVMIAAFCILCILPEYVLHPSFQLSFGAVLCLISGYEFYLKNSDAIMGNSGGILGSLRLYFLANIYSSFLASIVTGPFVIYHFYKFPNYSIFMNLLAVPLMSFCIMPLALLAIILMPINIDFWVLKPLGFFISIIISAADFIANLPLSILHFGYISDLSLIIFSFGFFWFCLWQTRWRFFGVFIMLLAVILMFNTKRPNLLYDHNIKAIALNNESEGMIIYTDQKMKKFTQDYWASWFGQKEINIVQHRIRDKDSLYLLDNGKVLALNYWSCQEADYAIIISKRLQCNNYEYEYIVTHQELESKPQIIIY